MPKRVIHISLLWILVAGMVAPARAAVFPPDCAQLHFAQIILEWHPVQYAETYTVCIKDDNTGSKTEYSSPYPCIRLPEPLAFGHAYTWTARAWLNGKEIGKVQQYQFSILSSPRVDTSIYVNLPGRMEPGKHSGGIIFLDNPGVAYDRLLRPIWFYPDTAVFRFFTLRQLPDGRISCLRPRSRTHVNNDLDFTILDPYSDSLVWKAPDDGAVSGDSNEHYHHDYQMLPDGNVLILGNEYVMKYNGFRDYPVTYGTIIEYDPSGKVVWQWKSSSYFRDEDLFKDGPVSNPTHMNAVFQETDGKHLWVSFKHIHQILRIEKSSGKVVARIGNHFPGTGPAAGEGLFHAMHSPLIGADGYMYLYDNGTGLEGDTISSAMCLDISGLPDSVTVRWEYFCRYGNTLNSFSEAKGNVQPLPNGNVMINMGSVPTTLEVSPKGEVVWEVFHRMRQYGTNADSLIWVPDNFRAFWTNSLYPQWMTLAPVWKGEVLYSLDIVNTGDLADSYRICLEDKHGKVIRWQVDQPAVKPGEVARVHTLRNLPKKTCAIRVFSTLNPDFNRVIYLP